MSDAAKQVLLYGEPIGEFAVRNSLSTFRFSGAYLDNPNRPVLGQQFEENLAKSWRQSVRVPTWFSNLLPEGSMREFLAEQLGESPRNESAFTVTACAPHATIESNACSISSSPRTP